jgi:hypothetical protein
MKILKWIGCHVFGAHDWTCNASKEIPPTEDQLKRGIAGFWEFAQMYCDNCGKKSKLNK